MRRLPGYLIFSTAVTLAALPPVTPVFAQNKQPPAPSRAAVDPVPRPPAPPARIPFPDELAGRQLLYAARDAYRNAPALRFHAKWTVKTDNGARVMTGSGTESLAAGPRMRRFVLTSETGAGDDRQVRRAIFDGATLLATRLQSMSPGAPPRREFVRLPLGPEDSPQRVLAQLQATPVTQAGRMLLAPGFTVSGVAWRGAERRVEGAPVEEIWEIVPARTQTLEPALSVRAAVTRRYLLRPKTHLPVRFEEWTVTEPLNAAARDPKANYPRRSYRREDYAQASVGATPLPAALFAQTLPPEYKETAPPDAPPATPERPAEADPAARRLLARWIAAFDRLLTFSADIQATMRREHVNPEAAAQQGEAAVAEKGEILYTVWLHKPGRARLSLETVGLPPERSDTALAVADGARVHLFWRRKNETWQAPLPDPAEMNAVLSKAGFNDWAGTLDWLIGGLPPQGYDQAIARGKRPLSGGQTADALEFVKREVDAKDPAHPVEVTTTMTFLLGPDGLPRQSERRQRWSVPGYPPSAQPPDWIITARYSAVRVNDAPPPGIFAFTPPRSATPLGGAAPPQNP